MVEFGIAPTQPGPQAASESLRPESRWSFPEATALPEGGDLILIGADLEAGTLLEAYRSTYFPMPIAPDSIGWFSPDPRGVIMPQEFHISRSLRKSCRRFETTVDLAFSEVLDGCADPSREHGWIDENIADAYLNLHRLGWAHSVEVWDDQGLAGGVYGIGIGAFFAGESMFHRSTDASKVALVELVNRLKPDPTSVLDVQWLTPHLESLGARSMARPQYAAAMKQAIRQPNLFGTQPASDSFQKSPK